MKEVHIKFEQEVINVFRLLLIRRCQVSQYLTGTLTFFLNLFDVEF